jgi:hypothetical protein
MLAYSRYKFSCKETGASKYVEEPKTVIIFVPLNMYPSYRRYFK